MPRPRGGRVSTVAPNHLDRQFDVVAPNTHWVTDITYIRTHECAVFYIDILHASGHLATYHESSMPVQYCIILHNHILTRFSATATIFVFTRLDTNRIISRIKYTVDNQRILARFQINRVTIL